MRPHQVARNAGPCARRLLLGYGLGRPESAHRQERGHLPVLESGARCHSKGVPVLLNGVLMAATKTKADASELATRLRAMRRDQDIPFDTTVALSEQAHRRHGRSASWGRSSLWSACGGSAPRCSATGRPPC